MPDKRHSVTSLCGSLRNDHRDCHHQSMADHQRGATCNLSFKRRGNSDMNMAVKATAAQFLADHEQLGSDLETANLRIEDQRKELEKLDVKVSLLTDALAQANTDKNTFLQYSFELSAQLQFIVSGSARALLIAGQVRNAIAQRAANIPPVAGADIAQLEDILHRIGEHNADANDGAGLTNGDDWRNANGAGDAPKLATPQQIKAAGAGPQDLPIGIDAPLVEAENFTIHRDGTVTPPQAGTLVDRDGNPIETSEATRMIKTL